MMTPSYLYTVLLEILSAESGHQCRGVLQITLIIEVKNIDPKKFFLYLQNKNVKKR